MPDGPFSQRRELGERLRDMRTAAGKSTAEAGAALSCSHSRISRIELARAGATLKPLELKELARLYGVTDDKVIKELLRLLEQSQQEGWWEPFADVMPPNLETYVALEADAVTERAWEPSIVHGLLQTEGYARAMYAVDRVHTLEQIERLIEMRMRRQDSLSRSPEPLDLWAILDEAVLRRPVGGPDVMREQVRHLIDLAVNHPHVNIQVVPYERGANLGQAGPFSLLELDDQTVAYIDSLAGNVVLVKPAEVRRLGADFDWLRAAVALQPEPSIQFMQKIAEEM